MVLTKICSRIIKKALFLFFILSSYCYAQELTLFDSNGQQVTISSGYTVTKCGAYGFAYCPNCFDTDSYYFELDSKKLISICGGACWHPMNSQLEVCKTLCPPPKWTCRDNPNNENGQ